MDLFEEIRREKSEDFLGIEDKFKQMKSSLMLYISKLNLMILEKQDKLDQVINLANKIYLLNAQKFADKMMISDE